MPTSWHYAEAGSQGRRREVKLIRCECGFVARGENDDQVVGMLREHLATDHPALLETVTRDDLIGWIQSE
jgi:predicted small metal-binding protein